ncbi:pro-thyrotropin-releasing hormone-A [Oncorhynchus nerka]|uniref:Pro-thyrotropin-releasing hormone-A n=1 Tax=Oncorhynchus nerka TaxID=8023 RepID=TRH_ONCNE|nr:pro-thyrotropin-releasing hormone-A [Oncorhynchus nerka]Q8QFQ9.1 RecName: Full=Pro-thyrotropin-releasing hormone-A; Short=Pro-TRH-A; AltName: Full=Prothyroliberin type A; Contains: RecName: Full=Thyrotropin-releasing hormone; Short=TRH; AltName: Full=Protirelin; AltName: Full=TSH-releasing factor; AltName: Full=Thyroliberin; AltName: Full=Thyrotropin-releasing factor; Short=TRF; Flags: Precursor [Oncorhynchus nerka]BAB88661.1 prepro-thyrotropin-releasing hormone [Oncorhynchus nerka]
MKSACLIILASLVVCNLTLARGQGIPAEEETGDRQTIDDIILQRAESLLLRSILKNIGDEDGANEGLTSQPEWLVKRQHPGKRYQEELEKRQHPGKREEDEDEDYDEVQKRQHPGKREDEFDSFVELQRRQHPGKRLILEQITENPAFLSELSKRQHPGKRYVMYYSKRQHPGRREVDDESDAGDLRELEKRQHPGKRYLDNTSPDLGANSPCDVLDPGCSKANLLLQLLDNVNKSRAEKRQHPGKRSAPVEDLTEQE